MSKKIAMILPAMFLLTGAACSPQPPAQPAQPANTINIPAVPVQPTQPAVPAQPAVPTQPANSAPINPPTIEQKTFNISGTDYKFTPSVINVTTNDQVRLIFKNDGKYPHNLSVQLPGGVTTRTIMPGETDAVAFAAPGTAQTINFWCTVDSHAALGMQGTIVVRE